MSIEIIIEIMLLGLALSMDAFAISITDGLIYEDINKKKSVFIAAFFGFMQAIMPLIGYFIVEIITHIVGDNVGDKAGKIMATTVSWIAFMLLVFIGGKMLIEGIKELFNKEDNTKIEIKRFSIKEVIYFGFATSIDALGTGVALNSGLSNNKTIWLHVVIIMIITFTLSFIGLLLGKKIEKLLKGRIEITSIIGGIILLIIGVWIILSHYLGI